MDQNFYKEMELIPRVSPEFELTLDTSQVLHSIETMSFFQMKGKFVFLFSYQWRSQDAEKVTHITGRLLDQAVILFNRVPFQNRNFSLRKGFDPEGANSFLYE